MEGDSAQLPCTKMLGNNPESPTYISQGKIASITQYIDETLEYRCKHCSGFCQFPPVVSLDRISDTSAEYLGALYDDRKPHGDSEEREWSFPFERYEPPCQCCWQ